MTVYLIYDDAHRVVNRIVASLEFVQTYYPGRYQEEEVSVEQGS